MSHPDNDADLDALLDDCLNTMDEQERIHEEKAQERAATRAVDQKSATAELNPDEATMINLLRTIMEAAGSDENTDTNNVEEKLASQIEEISAMLAGIPDITPEERQSYEQVLQLVQTLKDGSAASSKEGEGSGTSLSDGDDDKPSEEELATIRKVNELLMQLGEGEGVPATEAGSAGATENADSPEFAAEALLNVLLDPQLVEPLRQMRESYPLWLAENESKTSAEDLARYKRQHEITVSICDFLESGAVGAQDMERMSTLVALMHEYSSLAPLPPGLADVQPSV
ncbi:hypothetical protein, conserved [Trypanosoma brucei gambiense DAL972]|uniref:Peroxin 19 n=1 Tax=Trypanosoma brucei gambiense (strain MHOM/CI/86/DAL972) TaxID=679716 RepID=C9ZZ22_TRYB9|nr:hypothetical protein, conserved [Trypanosoma brucei gambiense DAL972]CBH14671.1 hypothetical protein, conserved [Trypanosoma brucei gambiense DAL972]|eukprot:XP_011776937.1 hypothetical protein, conserved [Trypanosoma brucei gambiense DAL972]